MLPVKDLLDAAGHSYLALDSIRAEIQEGSVVIHSLECTSGQEAGVAAAMAPGTAAVLAGRLKRRLRGCPECRGVTFSSRAA